MKASKSTMFQAVSRGAAAPIQFYMRAWRNGRRAGLRNRWATVQVQSLLPAPKGFTRVKPFLVEFVKNPLVSLPLEDARRLFDEMVDNVKEFLGEYLK